MNPRVRLVTRIGLFAALFYVLSWAFAWLPNVNPGFLVPFAAGLVWGIGPGVIVGALGMALYTWFNPYGPAAIPVAAAQVFGMALVGLLGALARPFLTGRTRPAYRIVAAALFGGAAGVLFYVPVTLVDAFIYQPFRERLMMGLPATSISLIANALVFSLLFPILANLYQRERRQL